MPAFLQFVAHDLALAARSFWLALASQRPLATALALLAMTGLLFIFTQVVRDAVYQGQVRREATAQHSAASWRCAAMPSLRLRDTCVAELSASPPRETLLPATPR